MDSEGGFQGQEVLSLLVSGENVGPGHPEGQSLATTGTAQDLRPGIIPLWWEFASSQLGFGCPMRMLITTCRAR